MRTQRATRPRCNVNRAYLSNTRDMDILAEIEHAELLAGLMIAVAFGICLFVGMVF